MARPVTDREAAVERLELIFPGAAFDTVLSSPLAGAAGVSGSLVTVSAWSSQATV